ncbi:MAG TPA: NAD(P)H-quinone oxidoreductase [Acidimicrobiia bacterium]|nr:NAD(P)H-quinone oxidoreductase [Acidimicrobiia bacterium]
MRAVIATGDDRITIEDRPVPEPDPDEVRIAVRGAGLNRADLLQRAGLYPAPPGVPGDIPGLEFSGLVDAIGASVADLAPGDAVWGVVGGGAQAEYLVTRADQCAPVPDGVDLVAAGGVPEAFVTAHDAMFGQAELAPGERVLVHAAGSGVGTAAIQLARANDCEIVGTARTADKLERAGALGLDHAVVVDSPFDARTVARQITDAAGPIDVVLDLVGGEYLSTDTAVAAHRGRIVLIGTMAGAQATLSILSVMSKRLRIYGTVLRPRTLDEKAVATHAFTTDTAAWFADDTVRPVVERLVPLADASDAYTLLASDATFGKVILTP